MTLAGAPRYMRYGGGEWMMRMDPVTASDKAPVLLIPPLFEEMNRLRALMAGVMRALATLGHASALPDLPGTNESQRALEECCWDDWRTAVALASRELGDRSIIAAFRGGCLLDEAAEGMARWRLAPVSGAMLIRDMERAERAGGAPMAGYVLGDDLRARLAIAEPSTPSHLRCVRLASDPSPADLKIEGPALWRRSEPGSDSGLAASIAANISAFSVICANF